MLSELSDFNGLKVHEWPKRPWLTIWTRPRGTIRAIINSDPTRHVWLLAILWTMNQALDRFIARSMGDDTSLVFIILLALIISVIFGPLGLLFSGFIVRKIGGLLGGQATSGEEIRAAIAWSYIPSIVSLALTTVAILIYGQELFMSISPKIESSLWPILILSAGQLVMGVRGLFILIKGVSEAHQFSAWRAMLTLALPIIFAVMLALAYYALTRLT
jgi:hypothetical protein